MDRSLRNRTLVFAGAMAFCVLYLLPTFAGGSLPSWFFDKKISLGLDLKGGAHFVYSIDLDTAVDDKAAELKRDIESTLAEKQIEGTVSTPSVAPGALTVRLTDPTKKAEVENLVNSTYGSVISKRTCAAGDGDAICVRISTSYAEDVRKRALSQAVKTVRDRIDEDGVAEPTVIQKDDQIIVELPGLKDEATARIQEMIARTAKLEFKIVENNAPVMGEVFRQVRGSDAAAAEAQGIKAEADSWNAEKSGTEFIDYYLTATDRVEKLTLDEAKAVGCKETNQDSTGKVECTVSGRRIMERYLEQLAAKNPAARHDDDHAFAFELNEPSQDGGGTKRPYWRSYYVKRAVELTGGAVSNALATWDPNTGRPEVVVEFSRDGGRRFGDLTSANVGRKMAIILDDRVSSAPVIQGAIRGGRSTITVGGANAQAQETEAQALVNVLKTGSLPAPLREESRAHLGPTLGRDAVTKAQVAFGLGALLVFAMMLFIYRWSGTIAVAGTFVNLILQLTVMAAFGATLTLPGIAALVLTIGFTVDGNILIYERIRDELHLGKSVKGAVDLGFSRAFSSILDGQLTTAAAGWVLLQYGSGPIHGFAVLLLIGIATTLFVNVWVTRLFFDWYIAKKKGELATISI